MLSLLLTFSTELALLAYAKGTVYNYGTNFNIYLRWCKDSLLDPVSSDSLNKFILDTFNSGKSYSKANTTYSAYLFFCKLNNIPVNLPPLTRLELRGFKRAYIRSKPTLWVTPEDLNKLLALWSPLQVHYFACLVLSYFTIVRPHELLAITWRDIDWTYKHITLPISKNDPLARGTFVRLVPQALSALQELCSIRTPNPEESVLPINYEQLNPWLASKCKAAGIRTYNWYALKHGGATYFALCGWTLKRITQHGRWKSEESARVYIHAPVRTD